MREKIVVDYEHIDYEKIAKELEGYLSDKEYKQGEYLAEDIWNNEKYSDEEAMIMILVLGYIIGAYSGDNDDSVFGSE